MGGRSGTRRVYPWDKWFARKNEFTLTQGEHFDVAPKVMAQQFRTRAALDGKKVSLKTGEGLVKVKVIHDA